MANGRGGVEVGGVGHVVGGVVGWIDGVFGCERGEGEVLLREVGVGATVGAGREVRAGVRAR